MILGETFCVSDHFIDISRAGASGIPCKALATVRFETWCAKVQNGSEKLKISDFRQGAFQNPLHVVLALLEYYMDAKVGIPIENMKMREIHEFLTFRQRWLRRLHLIDKT